MSEAKISKVVKVGYGFVEIGTNTLIVFASFYFLFYMTEALRIPPVYAGLLFFIAKIFDVITDPLVGNLSDRSSTPIGRRRPFMLAGGIMLGPTVAIMFLAPFVGSESWVPSALYFMVFTIATYLALTLIAVPGGAVTAEMTEDYNERTNITAWRWGVGSIGMFIGGAVAPLAVGMFSVEDVDPNGFRTAAIVMIPLFSLPVIIGVFMMRNAPRKVAERLPAILEQAKACFGTPSFRMLLATYFLQVSFLTIVTSNLLFVLKYQFQLEDPVSANARFFVIFVVATMASMAFWSWVGSKIGKKRGYIYSTIGLALSVSLVLLLDADNVAWLYPLMGLIGWFFGGYQLFPWSMIPDSVSEGQARTGMSLEGAYNGWFTTYQKIGIAFGQLVFGALLSLSGYEPAFYEAGVRVFPEQSYGAILMIRICSSLLPGAMFLLSLLFIMRHQNSSTGPAAKATS
jgi:glycoside/pentoside/hexuronide:cation symporter, GPH family